MQVHAKKYQTAHKDGKKKLNVPQQFTPTPLHFIP